MTARVAGAAIMMVTIVGCGAAGTDIGSGADQSVLDGTTAVAFWERFPVDAPDRPLVLVNGAIVEPIDGYLTDAAKLAGGSAAFLLPADPPSPPPRLAGYPIMGTEAALAVAQRSVDGDGAEPAVATEVRLDYAVFMTDRGPRTLPAWLVTIADATGPVALVAIDRPARFDGPLGFDRASIDAFGTEVTLDFVGAAAGTGSCTADYRLDVIEHHAFVETAVIETRDGGGDCSSVGYSRQASAILTEPLGARVLVSSKTGAAIVVTSEVELAPATTATPVTNPTITDATSTTQI